MGDGAMSQDRGLICPMYSCSCPSTVQGCARRMLHSVMLRLHSLTPCQHPSATIVKSKGAC